MPLWRRTLDTDASEGRDGSHPRKGSNACERGMERVDGRLSDMSRTRTALVSSAGYRAIQCYTRSLMIAVVIPVGSADNSGGTSGVKIIAG